MTKAAETLTSLTPERIRSLQEERIRSLLRSVVPANRFYTAKYAAADIDALAVESLDDFRRLPITTKAELVADHTAHPPYGTNLTFPVDAYARLHQTSGTTGTPLRWLDTPESWAWIMESWELIFGLVGLSGVRGSHLASGQVPRSDRLMFPFSFGPFIGFWAAFEGAARLGNLCIPGGGLSSEARLRMILDNTATFVCCTPTYALRLVEVAEQLGIDLPNSAVRGLIVAGEPGGNVPATRSRIETGWGARVFDHWGMTEIGPAAVESVAYSAGQYVLETQYIAEIVDPNSLDACETPVPVEPGAQGELLITTLGRTGSPVIRYRTGDLVVQDTDPSPDGLALMRLKGGILGRADDMLTIRGNNVFPSSIEAIVREFSEVAEYRAVVETKREMQHVRLELEPVPESAAEPAATELADRVRAAIKDRLNFVAEVALVPPDSLPRFELKGKRFVRT